MQPLVQSCREVTRYIYVPVMIESRQCIMLKFLAGPLRTFRKNRELFFLSLPALFFIIGWMYIPLA